MSDYRVEKFNMPEFDRGDIVGGGFSTTHDDGKEASPKGVASGRPKAASILDSEFHGEQPETKEDLIFETEFTSKSDINTLLENAKAEAAEMIENAKREVGRIEQEAYDKGFQKGKEDGLSESREEGIQKLLPSVEAFDTAMKEMSQCRKTIYKNCEAELIELFNTLSRRVIHRELGQSNEFILDIIKEAMKEITQQEQIKVRLNSADLEYAESFKTDLISELGSIKNLTFEKDDSITRGGCVIETNFGEIDSCVESKILEIEKMILKEKPEKETYKTEEKKSDYGGEKEEAPEQN